MSSNGRGVTSPLYYVRGRRMDYTSSSSGCVAVRVRDCACRLISICTVAARTVAAHLSQLPSGQIAWPGQTGHTHTGRFEHGWPFILYNSETILFILFCVKQKVFCCAKLLLNKVYY